MDKANSFLSGTDGNIIEERFLSALFCDGSERFRIPSEPDSGERVKLRLRTPALSGVCAFLLIGSAPSVLPMELSESDGTFAYYETEVIFGDNPVSYIFVVEYRGRRFAVKRTGAEICSSGEIPGMRYAFRVTPGFHTPEWAKGALQYQIFVDRFCNGDPSNDVIDGEYFYGREKVRAAKWDALPKTGDYRVFHGGDLRGVLGKLDYLQSLGVEAIYLNPVFVSPSSHKYDTQDYAHIDPHFGIIADDSVQGLPSKNNGEALTYINRTANPVNLEASDALFGELCGALHSRGMKVILDGVFNHCGSFSKWMDREGIYRGGEGAYRDPDSKYRSYFRFEKNGEYESWWGINTLPKLSYETSPELVCEIIDIACKWAKPPYSIDGWRLDVACDLGHGREYNHSFWRYFRSRLKEINPDILIIAEHYGDPSEWLGGDQWDGVMNYDAFMEPVTFFLTGMDKHSDYKKEDLYLDGDAFLTTLLEKSASFDRCSLLVAMNELSNHDHSRFMTRTNRKVGRVNTAGSGAASHGTDKDIYKIASVMQYTLPGAPTLYYGDEAGLCGWTDPDDRRAYPWGNEDAELIAFHRELYGFRKKHPCVRKGSFKPVCSGRGYIAYARFDGSDRFVTVCSAGETDLELTLRLIDVGFKEGEEVFCAFFTGTARGLDPFAALGRVEDGELKVGIPAKSAVILV